MAGLASIPLIGVLSPADPLVPILLVPAAMLILQQTSLKALGAGLLMVFLFFLQSKFFESTGRSADSEGLWPSPEFICEL